MAGRGSRPAVVRRVTLAVSLFATACTRVAATEAPLRLCSASIMRVERDVLNSCQDRHRLSHFRQAEAEAVPRPRGVDRATCDGGDASGCCRRVRRIESEAFVAKQSTTWCAKALQSALGANTPVGGDDE